MNKLLLYYSLSLVFCVHVVVSDATTNQEHRGILQAQEKRDNLSVLLITMEEAGHSIPMLALGEALVEKGHKVTLLAIEVQLSDSNTTMTNLRTWCWERNITFASAGVLTWDMPERLGDFSSGLLASIPLMGKVLSSLQKLQQVTFDVVLEDNQGLLQSSDVVILDFFFSQIVEWLNDNTQLTVMSLTQTIPFYSNTLPSWYYPSFPLNPDSPSNPTITDRFKNVLLGGVTNVLMNTVGRSIKDIFPIHVQSGSRNPDIAATSFGFDYPRPLYPLTHYVGPIVSKRNQPLSDNLKAWLDNHTTPYSVVYLSMGSFMTLRGTVAHAIVHGVMEAGYDLLWSLKDSNREILDYIDEKYLNSSRILISKWLPQSTVLSHPSISMAILHGGFGGINEALIAGVPVICLPQGLDQPMNCARVNHQGLGVDFGVVKDLTVPQVKQAIQDVKDYNCREKAKKVSRIFKAAGGASKAVELIEYYHEIGYDHLIPAWSKYNWNFIQYYNLDVHVVMFIVIYLCCLLVGKARHLYYKRRVNFSKSLKSD